MRDSSTNISFDSISDTTFTFAPLGGEGRSLEVSIFAVIERPGGNDDAEYYVYDSEGNRVRKVTVANGETIDKKLVLPTYQAWQQKANT